MDARSIEEAWKKVTLKMEDMKEQSVLQKLIVSDYIYHVPT